MSHSQTSSLTTIEMAFVVFVLALTIGIYLFLVDSYKSRRMSEQAAKALMLAARAEEDFFAKEHRYFDAEVTDSGGEGLLITTEGTKITVQVPPKVKLRLKSKGKDRPAFTGQAHYSGGKVLHTYDSETGKIVTVSCVPDEAR